ncbi:MAG: TonB-dependent receptor [Vicinamibacterales bacterium]
MHVPSWARLRRLVVPALLLGFLVAANPLSAQPAPPAPLSPAQSPPRSAVAQVGGTVSGVVSTQDGAIPLGGIVVTLMMDSAEVGSVASEGDGSFRFEGLEPGSYTVVAAPEGFQAWSRIVTVTGRDSIVVKMDLKLAAITEVVEVLAGGSGIVPDAGTLTSSEGLTARQLEEIGSTGGLQAALRMLVSVIEVPGGVSIKGGRPSQASVQLGPGAFVDPATGLSDVSLPDDAIDSVTVLPNPYAVEFGRFSSGLVLINTRRAADTWRTRLNRLEPSFRTRRGSPLHILGISGFSPRAETGGPLIKDRLYLQQAVQYRYRANEVASRPQSELRESHRFSSYTRLDGNLTPRHSIVGSAGFFPATSSQTTLGTFTPPEASVNMRGNVNTVALTERALWSDTLFAETTVEVHGYSTDVIPRGPDNMELLPETTLGNFFNRQHRNTSTFQVIESVSGTSQGRGGLHLYKAGIDLLHSRFRGWSESRPVLIRRSDGRLVRRLDFAPGATNQRLDSTDLAIYAQDRLQPGQRYYVEFGARLDRDGVIGRFNLTPRVGAALLLNQDGTSVIRSGYGLFYERTPSVAGVFGQYEAPIDTRYAADGETVEGTPVSYRHVVDPNLRTARSLTWDVAFDHRFTSHWATHVGVIDRRGRRELLLTRTTTGEGPAIVLDSSGRSKYREVEFGVHFTGGHGIDVNASYVRALARSDLNSFTTFYDSVLWPVVADNAYAAARTEVPHRLLIRGRANPTPTWLLVGVMDWRTGMPYSVVDEALEFVGPRNSLRFPTYFRVDLGLEHRFKIGKYRPWIGIRVDNALRSFLPADVQANLTSPAFGNFYNSEFRQARIQVRFER